MIIALILLINENVESAIFSFVRPLGTNEKRVDDEPWE